MRDLIRKLLRENLDIPNYDDLYNEGKKYFHNLVMKDWPTKNGIERLFFKDFGRSKISYNIKNFIREIYLTKMRVLRKWILSEIDSNMSGAMTGSIYFTYNGKKYRISDHPSGSFNGVSIILQWNTQINDVKQQIKGLLNENISPDLLKNTKIVGPDGKPLLVHRSQKNERKQDVTRASNLKGIYFSADEQSTKIYGDNTKHYYLNIENPIVLKDTEWNLSVIPEYIYNMLIAKGYDGAVWLRKGVMYEIVAFYSNQVFEA